MNVASVVLVETSLAGNLGAAFRVAANFGVPRIDLVRPHINPLDPEVRSWACGADRHVECRQWGCLEEAAAGYRSLVASASGRGRHNLPVVSPREVVPLLMERGIGTSALVFGNETSGLSKHDLDRCDLVVRVPTRTEFPVLNLAQAIAILVADIHQSAESGPRAAPEPAPQSEVEALMSHLRTSLTTIGFLDPQSPQRILRKFRRLFGRAGITENEVKILRGMCRQMEWAARSRPSRFDETDADTSPDTAKDIEVD
jgi:tRNA/rRNA methyltransferase